MSWVQTYTGKAFDFDHIREEDIDILDIAHSLSLQCRFNGHTSSFYSVGEHSVLVARRVEKCLMERDGTGVWRRVVRAALLHDAAEAYLGDLVRPIKILDSMAEFRELEQRVSSMIRQVFDCNISPVAQDLISYADEELLATEAKQLMAEHPRPWDGLPKALDIHIECWEPQDAERRFLTMARKWGAG